MSYDTQDLGRYNYQGTVGMSSCMNDSVNQCQRCSKQFGITEEAGQHTVSTIQYTLELCVLYTIVLYTILPYPITLCLQVGFLVQTLARMIFSMMHSGQAFFHPNQLRPLVSIHPTV